MRLFKPVAIAAPLTLAAALFASAAQAATCTGACGVLGANGVVTAPPVGANYTWISTFGGVDGVGQIAGAGGTDGTTLVTSAFTAHSGDLLRFYFDYVTSDGHLPGGTNYEDYAWVELQTAVGDPVAMLFTARTEASGSIVPGSGLPGVSASLTPGSVPITAGAPDWSPLGGFSGQCWGPGCGYTGWIRSDYTVAAGGDYRLVFGVTNFVDNVYDSGLAINGLTIGDREIDDGVPEPATWALILAGFGLVGATLRRGQMIPAA